MNKLLISCALLSAVALAIPVHQDDHYDQHSEPHYEFGYSVEDKHTGDVKNQHESRHHDQVQGEYSLVEPDGHVRNVKYHADKHSGFNAVVHREATLHHAPQHGGHGHQQIVQLAHNDGHGHGIALGNIGGNAHGHGISSLGHSGGVGLVNLGGHGIGHGHGIALGNIGGSSHGHGILSDNLGGHGSHRSAGHNNGGHHEVTGTSTVYLHAHHGSGHNQNVHGHHY